jgi:hypothetical protein
MADNPVLEHVENLEKTLEALVRLPVEVADLKGRVGSLEVQIVQLRAEMTEGISALRREVLELFDAGSNATESLFQETWAQMRVLHEDVIERLKHIGGGPH